MKKHICVLILVAILCLSVIVRNVTAQGGVAAYLVMIANQGTQISNQVQALTRMDNHIAQLTGQFQHLRDSALGQIGAITDPIADLVAAPTQLLNTTRNWHSDFTGPAGDMVTAITDLVDGTSFSDSWQNVLQQADTVSVADIGNIYQSDPSAAAAAIATYQRQRDYADRRLVLAHARSDAAAALAATAKETQEKIDSVAGANNVSSTALQQAILTGNLSQGQLSASLAQMDALDASAAAAEEYDAEVLRREIEARRLADRAALEARWAQERAVLATTEAQRIESMYGGFRLHPVFQGN